MAPLPVTLTSRFNNILSEFRPKLLHAEQIRRSVRREILINYSEIANLSTRSLLLRRGLSVDSTQKVTLGVIAAYAIVIAILWNLRYVRWSLWPFKVSDKQQHKALFVDIVTKSFDRCLSLLSMNLDMLSQHSAQEAESSLSPSTHMKAE